MILLDKVNKFFNKNKSNQVHALNNISLELPEKGMVAIFGKSGCGKTTLLNAIGGLDGISSGNITIDGADISQNADTVRNKHIGYIFQNYCLNKNQTVFENVASALYLCGITDPAVIEKRTISALDKVGMKKFIKRTPDALSGGQQQRVAIARAIVKSPSIILADEPTGNIDENNTVIIMDLLKAISKDSLVLLVTHEAHLVDHYCDRIIEISDGQVVSVRDNDAKGYSKRDKHAIYLGELEGQKTELSGIDIEYYGEPCAPLKLRIVNAFGKIYLEAVGSDAELLSSSGEIRLYEGKFEDVPEDASKPQTDISPLPPIEGKRYGRLFTFSNSIKSAFSEYFAFSKKKKNVLLSVCLIILSFILVSSSANFGVGVREYLKVKNDHNDSLFYIPITSDLTSVELIKKAREEGCVDFAGIVSNPQNAFAPQIPFSYSGFITGSNVALHTNGTVMSARFIEDYPVVCGTNEFKNRHDMVITDALANDLLASSPVGFISEYSDLLGLTYNFTGNISGRIVGIVDCNDKYYFLEELYASHITLNVIDYIYPNVFAQSVIGVYDKEIPEGSAVMYTSYGAIYEANNINIAGMTFNLLENIRVYSDLYEYDAFVSSRSGILSFEEYRKNNSELSHLSASCEWFFNHYFSAIPEFCKAMDSTTYLTFESWVLNNYYNDKNLLLCAYQVPLADGALKQIELDLGIMYACYLYKTDKGVYPTDTEQLAEGGYLERIPTYDDTWNELEPYQELYSGAKLNYSSNFDYGHTIVISDKDYMSLTYNVGKSSPEVICNIYGYTDEYPDHYIALRSSSVEKTEQFLSSQNVNFITPDEFFETLLDASRTMILMNSVSLAVMLALMCVFVFFIMKSVMMGKVKEIGICRAIGVSKKNLLFKFYIDVNLLTITTVVVGCAISSVFIHRLSLSAFFAQQMYYPVWLALGVTLAVYCACAFFGMLPLILLLRKTPSAILAKYDI